MTIQNLSLAAEQNAADQADQSAEVQLPKRTIANWQKPAIAELSLGLEVTAYIYHWQ